MTIIAILNIIGGSLMVIGGLGMMSLGAVLPMPPESTLQQPQSMVPGADVSAIPADLLGGGAIAVGAVLVGLGALSSFVAYGLLTGKPWAWTVTVGLAIVSMVLNAISLVAGNVAAIVGIAISAVIMYYMYRPYVKAYFGKAASTEPSTAAPA